MVIHIPSAYSQQVNEKSYPVVGFCIAAPAYDKLEEFISFIDKDLATNGINTLVLRVDYNYEYKSFPNLSSERPLSEVEVERIVHVCKRNNIRLVPQINLLGHQSWANRTGKLLQEYPEFDETPHIVMPEKYEWPNDDGLYCKSYCPRHPEVHKVIFALVDELMEVFEADAFHAGMDEVFYIGDDKCSRCSGEDKARLFAEEVVLIHDHLAEKGRELWIWGDRLLDGEITGIGMWEASMNETHPAIDMIPKDVVIWDWHYERAEPTAVWFAMKGFRVVSCFWNKPDVAKAHVETVNTLRENSNPVIASRILGIAQTVWNPADQFMSILKDPADSEDDMGSVNSYKTMIRALNEWGD
ncbi:MAG: family 20 glycosylhydrolase [Bacteroidales bacterium]|nr:family 20 glycosylhydrolase [Bacteroidales bacterium]